MVRRVWFLVVLVLAWPVFAAAQPAIYLVRHAERADSGPGGTPPMASPGAPAADPDLSDAGHARAASLAAALKDANITAVFATGAKRTQQTAAPLAQALGLAVIVIPADSPATLVARLKALSGSALVVGHSNTLPAVIGQLGVRTPVEIADTAYDNLFIVVRGNPPAFLRLHYR
jgi:broad specificity phosphatase PhoE